MFLDLPTAEMEQSVQQWQHESVQEVPSLANVEYTPHNPERHTLAAYVHDICAMLDDDPSSNAERLDALIATGCIECLVSVLQDEMRTTTYQMLIDACAILAFVTAGERRHTLHVVERGAVPHLVRLMQTMPKKYRALRYIVRTLANIACETDSLRTWWPYLRAVLECTSRMCAVQFPPEVRRANVHLMMNMLQYRPEDADIKPLLGLVPVYFRIIWWASKYIVNDAQIMQDALNGIERFTRMDRDLGVRAMVVKEGIHVVAVHMLARPESCERLLDAAAGLLNDLLYYNSCRVRELIQHHNLLVVLGNALIRCRRDGTVVPEVMKLLSNVATEERYSVLDSAALVEAIYHTEHSNGMWYSEAVHVLCDLLSGCTFEHAQHPSLLRCIQVLHRPLQSKDTCRIVMQSLTKMFQMMTLTVRQCEAEAGQHFHNSLYVVAGASLSQVGQLAGDVEFAALAMGVLTSIEAFRSKLVLDE